MTPAEQNRPVLPLRDSVLFPGVLMPLVAGRPASASAVEAAAASEDKHLVVATQHDPGTETPGLGDLYPTACLAVIKKLDRIEDVLHVMVQGTARVELLAAAREAPFIEATVRELPEPGGEGADVEALQRAVLELAGKVAALVGPQTQLVLRQAAEQIHNPLVAAYTLGAVLPLATQKRQALLSAGARAELLKLLHGYLVHELDVLQLRREIESQAETEMSREQRRYLLRQQLRAIQEELGEGSPEQVEAADLRRRLEQADLPDNIREEAERELRRLEATTQASPDYQLTRSHLEMVVELPWRHTTDDRLDLRVAREVLDEDHYGLADVKERVLEHLAVMKLNPAAQSPILCFVGPPGVGKTSLGKSIARALGRKFERMSLGGLHDEAELRGHRRTYIGAMPGRIMQAIRRAGVRNPVLMLDEVDKLSHGFHGDPAAALLEILDPAQNFEFHDNYVDLPFDLSDVFFITTANTLDPIPQPLLDRMEVHRLSGYTDDEKVEIARRYLVPRQREQCGLRPEQLQIPDDVLRRIIRRRTREAGVRQLDRELGNLCRKVAARVATGSTEAVALDLDQLGELLGPERFFEEETRRSLPPGVVPGLAWTQAGGEVMYVEAVLLHGRDELVLTGQLGEVMKESARAAQSFLHSIADDLGIAADRLRTGVHIHVPAGATPKDGPSAGVAMATALASLHSRRPARSDTAMTGEITLSGLVLPVGGIKEKVLAAHRAAMKRVILPRQNERDLVELPANVRADLEIVLVERVTEALAAAIPELRVRSAVGT